MGLSTYLTFDGNCEQAMQFYAHALGTQINEMHRYKDMPNEDIGPEFGDRIMHANLIFDGTTLMASDSHPQMGFDGKHCGFAVSVSVGGTQQAETVFAALSEGAQAITMPIQETFWAQRFGMLTDKFGVEWMVNCDKAADISY